MSLPNKLDYVTRSDRIRVNVGDLDQRRNLKFRAFVLLVLRPLFDELEEKFGFRKMAFRGGVHRASIIRISGTFPGPTVTAVFSRGNTASVSAGA